MSEQEYTPYKKVKTCTHCKIALRLSFFIRDKTKKDGYRSTCKDCSKIAKQLWYEKNKSTVKSRARARLKKITDFITQSKDVPCTDCHKKYHFSLMDLDHVRGEKLDTVRQVARRTFSLDKVKAELEKCEVVCCMCHRVRSWNRMFPDQTINT